MNISFFDFVGDGLSTNMSVFNNWSQEESDGVKYRAKHPLDDSRYDYVLAGMLNLAYIIRLVHGHIFCSILSHPIAIHACPTPSYRIPIRMQFNKDN